MKITTVIVDDEQPICDEVAYLLRQYSNVDIIGTFTNSIEALSFIVERNPHLLILDIQMPGLTGLEMANKLSVLKQPPLIVFLTAHTCHALEAFSTPAVGYLTKPVNDVCFNKMMQKVKMLLPIETKQTVATMPERLCVYYNNKIIPLDKSQIIFAYTKEKEVFVITESHEYLAPITLQEFEVSFSPKGFMRVHRQYVVNLQCIQEIIPWFHGSFLLRMNDKKKTEIPVSRSNLKMLKAAIGLK